MSINTCKECGKQFEAKSPRVAYCSDIHYRPCPICGKPVEAKYLSDPPRRCEDCKGKSIPKMKPKVDVRQDIATRAYGADIRTYVMDKPILGFIPGHDYELEIEWKYSVYNVSAVRDVTADMPVDLLINLSSQISIDRYFAKKITA